MSESISHSGQTRIRPLRSISIRLPLFIAGSLVLLVALMAGISYFETRRGLEKIQEVNLRTQAGNQATTIERTLRDHVTLMENLASRQTFLARIAVANNNYFGLSDSEIQTDLRQRSRLWDASVEAENYSNPVIFRVTNDPISQNELAPEATSINDAFGYTNHFMLVDREGALVATSQPDRVPEKLLQTETPWWQAVHETGSIYIGSPHILMGSPVTIMDFAVPLKNQNGNIIGVLYSSFDYSAVRDQIRETQAADTSRTALVEQDGSVLFASSALPGVSDITDLPLRSASESLSLYEAPNGNLYVLTAEPLESSIEAIENIGWYVAAIQLEADAFQPINASLRTGILTAGIVGTLIMLGLFFGYIRPLTSSLDSLRSGAQSLQEGAYNTQVPVTRQDEMGLLASTFNQMAMRLRNTIQEQESIITNRTADLQRRAAQLETAAQVGQVASASLELDVLMADTVNLIRDKFGYYHASVFLLDDAREYAVVRESTGEVGKIMKTRPHRLAVGSNSIVGWVTKHHEARIALNVGEDAVHFNNPLLPDTQSEVALPLISQKRLLGALDVQSKETNAFDHEDLAVLQLMADQVAAAIYNARLFTAVQTQAHQRRQIIDLWQQLNTMRDTSKILEATCMDVRHKVGYDAVVGVLVEGNEWYVDTAAAIAFEIVPKTNIYRPIGTGVVGQSILHRKPILNTNNDDPSDRYDLDFPKVGGQASAPIIVGDEVLGAIALYSRQSGRLDENDLSLLEIITTAVGSAISNARLLTETENNLKEINRLYRQAIQSRAESVTIESVYKPRKLNGAGKANLVNIPLISHGRQIGQVEIEGSDAQWSKEQHLLSEAIANQAALALENSTFFNQTQSRLKETEALLNLSSALSTTMDVEEIYRRAAQTIAELLDVSRCAISSWQPDENTVTDEADFIRDSENQIVNIFDNEHLTYDLAEHTGTANVLKTLKPLFRYRSDPNLEPSEKELLNEFNLDLCLEIPMITRNEAFGIVELYRDDESKRFSEYEVRLAKAMANQAATVLRNAELAAEAQTRIAELSTLYRISETLSLAPDLNSVFTNARQEIMKLINATGVAISLLNEDRNTLKWIYIYEREIELSVESLPEKSIEEGFGGYVVRNSKSVLENQITAETMAEYNSEILTGAHAASYMGLPLRVANETIGVLGIENNDSYDAFSQNDLLLMETIAGSLGIAIENQRLLEQTRDALLIQSQQSLQLQAASDVSAAASSILDTEELMVAAVNLIQERFALYYVGLFLIDSTGNDAQLRAGTGKAGRIQLENRHQLEVGGRSLIGGATDDGQARIVQDVTMNKEWRPNPILPDTRSELALPMRVRGRIIGALTVQSTEPNEFGPEVVNILQSMADQLAIAIENSRLFAQIQETLTEIQEANNRLRELDQLKTQFLANMSHELRTPLNSIIGFSRVILKGIDGPITAEQEEDLTSIHSSGQHLLSLINDILDVARIEAGKMTLAYEYVDVKEMATSVNATVRGLVKDKDIDLDWQIEEGLPPVEADAIRLRQILLNFLSNAAKFTETGCISLFIFQEGPYHIHIAIQDTGIGIAEEDFDLLFEAFEQVDSSVTRSFGGTGLGLPITKKLVELHQGQVWVESEVGHGSVFHVMLPLSQSLADIEFPKPRKFLGPQFDSQPYNGDGFNSKPTILVVDDEPGVGGLYERYLRSQPYQVLQANSGAEALQTIMEHNGFIHLILLDINMPGLTGWDVLKEMHDNPDIRDIPVIICSIENEPDKAAALGARQSLLKPIVEDDLLHALQEVGING
ncbi:MAG: GAF domain-containing protein [Candidatus Promineifilaceae bacterium]